MAIPADDYIAGRDLFFIMSFLAKLATAILVIAILISRTLLWWHIVGKVFERR